MSKKNLASFAIVLIFILISYHFLTARLAIAPAQQAVKIDNIKSVNIAGQNIKVELAVTEAEQELGLSGRSGLKEDEGMLFIFEQAGAHGFWMKDMNFPIDIIWLNPARNDFSIADAGGENMKVVYIKKDARPESYPEIYSSDKDSKYVLEVASGFSDKNGLKIGDEAKSIH